MKRNTDTTEDKHASFYSDMRFWIIVAMITAFLAFTLIRYPG
jgi:hypothetical protein